MIYNKLKILKHPDRLCNLKDNGYAYPVHVLLYISDLCNHDCYFCVYRSSSWPSSKEFANSKLSKKGTNNPIRQIPSKKCFEIIDDCYSMGVRAISFTGGGEPTIHPDCSKIFSYASDKMECGLVTNGSLLHKKGILESIEKFKWVRVSLDAGTEETYSKIHRVDPSVYETVIHNIMSLKKVGISVVVTKDNWQELEKMVLNALYLKVNHIRFSYYLSFQNEYGELFSQIKEKMSYIEDKYSNDIKIYNQFSSRKEICEDSKPDYDRCYSQYINPCICGDQKVYRCCTMSYNQEGLIGSIENQSFKQLWSRFTTFHNMYNFNPSKACRLCPVNQKNKAIAEIVEDNDKEDVNFV